MVQEENELSVTRITLEWSVSDVVRQALAVWCNMKEWDVKFGFFYFDRRDGEINLRDSTRSNHSKA
jgi:hypothetical protein